MKIGSTGLNFKEEIDAKCLKLLNNTRPIVDPSISGTKYNRGKPILFCRKSDRVEAYKIGTFRDRKFQKPGSSQSVLATALAVYYI